MGYLIWKTTNLFQSFIQVKALKSDNADDVYVQLYLGAGAW